MTEIAVKDLQDLPPTIDIMTAAKREAYTKHAIDQGVFGAPFFIIDGERFWGQDRIDFVERKLAS